MSAPLYDNLEKAEYYAKRIRDFWAKRGHAVETRLEPYAYHSDKVYAVRSDMVNGLPRKGGRKIKA